MKIFFIASDIPYPGFTGGSVVNWSIVEYLISQNHKITVFSDFPRYGLNKINDDLREKMINNIQKFNCEFYSLNHTEIKIKKKNKLQRFVSNKLEDYFPELYSSTEIENIINKKFNELKPDLLICYGAPAIYFTRNIKCLKGGWCESIKSIFISTRNFKTLNPLYFAKSLIAWLKVSYIQKILIKELNKIDIRFIHSKDLADDLVKWGAKSCKFVLPPYYDAKKFLSIKKKEKRSYFKILVIGLLSNVNLSQIEILRKFVFPAIEKNLDFNNVQFHFIGVKKSDLPEDFQNKDYIIGRGFVEDIHKELDDCDLLYSVTPKPFGFRSRLCEALSLGVCILTSKFDQLSIPFLKDGYNCYIVEDIKLTGLKILEIIKNNEANKIIKINARKSYEDNLSYNIAGEKFEKLILGN
tara:strand:+ start:5719 stop:6951 length:1233 start_codon:yes stop_codon:yes gene_type:complete